MSEIPPLFSNTISARSSCCSRADILGCAGLSLKQPGHISMTCRLLGFYGSLVKRGLVVLYQFLCCGREKQQGLNKGHQRGSLYPAAGAHIALPFLQHWPFGLSSLGTEASSGQSCGWAPGVPRLLLLKGPASLPSRRAAAPPQERDLGKHPHLPSSLLCRVALSVCETAPSLGWTRTPPGPLKVTRCRGFTSSSGPRGGIARSPKRLTLPVSPHRWPTWKSHPSAAAWEMPIGQICCCQRKTKPLPSRVAGDKKGAGTGAAPWRPLGNNGNLFGSWRGKAGQRLTLPSNSSCCLDTKQGVANLVSFI